MDRKLFLKSLLLLPLVPKALAQNPKVTGDGIKDDSEAFREHLKHHDLLELSEGKIYKIGNVVLKGKTIRGPGKIKIVVGANSAFILEGNNNHIENVEFVSEGRGQRPESEILLGPELEYAVIKDCSFKGNLFNAVGSNMNDTKDAPYVKTPLRSKLIISQCQFNGAYAHHLYFHRIENLIIQNNFFENSKLDSIRLRQLVKTATIAHNVFKQIGTSSSNDSKDAIDCYWSGLELNIQGNQMTDIATHGLDIKGHSPDQDYGTSRVIISGNQIRKAGFSGILISSGDRTGSGWNPIKHVTISQNHIEGCGFKTTNPNDAAIFMRHNQEMITVDGNQIYGNLNKGIMLGNFEKDADNSRNILIKGNLVTGNGRKGQKESYGIHIMGGINVLVSENIMDQNHSKGLVAEPYRNFKLLNYKAANNLGED